VYRVGERKRERERCGKELERLEEDWVWKNWKRRWKLRSRLWKFGNEKGGRRARERSKKGNGVLQAEIPNGTGRKQRLGMRQGRDARKRQELGSVTYRFARAADFGLEGRHFPEKLRDLVSAIQEWGINRLPSKAGEAVPGRRKIGAQLMEEEW
jgi:hypothetical protein